MRYHAAMHVPGYKIIREIGRGGMATVFLAVQESLDREVALKIMSTSLVTDEIFCKRFVKEGRIAAKLNHPNLLTVHDIGQHGDTYYMASEYLPAGSVRQRMREGIKPDAALKIVAQVAAGLQYAHDNGFVHRDVKPGNLLFRHDGSCVLADFGIAKGLHSNTIATKIGTSIGTPHYMSPEQARGDKVDGRTDIYSLGVVWYEMLVGRPPFDGDNAFSVAMSQINDPVPALPAPFARFQPIINRMLEKARENRYAGGNELIEALRGLAGSSKSTPAAAPKRAPAAAPKAQQKRPAPKRPPPSSPDVAETTVMRTAAVQSKPSGVGKVAVIAVLLLAVGALGYVGYDRFMASDADSAATLPTSLPAASTSAETAPPVTETDEPAPVEPEARNPLVQEREPEPEPVQVEDPAVARLLAEGDDYFARAQYAYPPGENATERYRAALDLDPDNARARARMAELAEIWADAASASLRDGNQNLARSLVRRGLEADPQNPRLRELSQQLQ